jgi:V/A-type H+-transporting ATPase subunit I
MLTPAHMQKAHIYVLERDVREVARALGRLGIVHLSSSVEESGGRLAPEAQQQEAERCRDLTERVKALMEDLDLPERPSPRARAAEHRKLPSLDEAERLIETVEQELAPIRQDAEEAEEALADAESILAELEPYKELKGAVHRLAESTFLEIKIGRAPRARYEDMRRAMPDGVLLVPLGPSEGEGRPIELLAVAARRRRFAMETVLQEHGFQEENVPPWQEKTPAELYREAAQRRRSLQARLAALRTQLKAAGRPHAEALREVASALRVQGKLIEAARNFGATWATAVISGWLPADKTGQLRTAVREAAGERAVIETADPDPEDVQQGRVPTSVVTSSALKPFQRLVRGYGVASYTELEPTLLFAVSFLLMFGLIFGDLGHGLSLVAVGLMTRRLAQGQDGRDLGFLIFAAGLASALFGAFFQGSFFGKSLAGWGFPLTLGFEPMRFEVGGAGAGGHIVRYLLLAVGLGMVLISLGTVLNVINRLRAGDFEGGLLGRFGLVGVVFYWGAVAVAVKLAVAGAGAADVWLVAGLVLLPLLLLTLHRPIYGLLSRRRPVWGEHPVLGVFEGLIEALEMVLTYTANTFSFLRVAAFALSHAALCFTIFVLLRLVSDLPGGPLWSAILFVVGTAFVIALEGLIVAVQIMRLEYYEFFTKFFRGEGVRYEPFRLD